MQWHWRGNGCIRQFSIVAVVTTVYGPQDDDAKLRFLNEMRALQQLTSDRWLLIGDFNLILQAEDKSNYNLNRRLMGAFRRAVDDMELKEPCLKGRKFTWSNNRTQTRIDRAFCTAERELMMPNCHLQAISSLVSDHAPLVLSGDLARHTYRGFRFEFFWPKFLVTLKLSLQHGTNPPLSRTLF